MLLYSLASSPRYLFIVVVMNECFIYNLCKYICMYKDKNEPADLTSLFYLYIFLIRQKWSPSLDTNSRMTSMLQRVREFD